MKHDDSISGRLVARNSARILAVGLITVLLSGAVGALISVMEHAPPQAQALAGWAILGVILFGFPIIVAMVMLRRP
jgi:hypothetical protein